ncbi:MAG: 23S rRNA (uracil(1939)-C(5))-methyltransferase RlmD [Prevotellaceae bacterium]|nr:23S rRNA (uracil(1939)-C(5))-methyltransferase RlmD [Prevotellaceae bacterium]MDY3855573.1 23S rRNA (uracil(1939)-C(5))-methyltransferase RlmD [Bacteroidaceae bacterium]
MTRNKKPLPILEHVTMTGFAAEGKSVARVDGYVVFVPFVVPGDVVDLQVTRKKHSYMEARAIKFYEYSADRVTPLCPHFGVCGGCKWQMLNYAKQLEYKQQQVVDQLMRLGKLDIPEIRPILGATHIERYRNKLEFSFSNKRWLTTEEVAADVKYDCMDAVGFHIPGAFDKVLDVTDCHLMDDLQNRVRNGLRSFALDHHISFFDLRQQTGLLRDMMFRLSNSGEAMLLMQFHITNEAERAQSQAVLEYLASHFDELTTIVWVNNLKANDTIGDLPVEVYKGRGYVLELMEDLKFKVGPKSFYQTNNEQAYNLYKVVRDFCGLTGHELVYDLYTGTGTIANFVARRARRVIGIEYVPEAIEDAKVNARLNSIDNAEFLAGDMKEVLTDSFVQRHGRPDVLITDPPRVGMHKDVVSVILHTRPERIVYVSCNPATQARDAQLLAADYDIIAIQPVDMFPHTQHIENVMLLQAKPQAE